MSCRHCKAPLEHVFLDLGFAPPSNAYLCKSDLRRPETWYPLKLFVCDKCWLVQTEDYARADELFNADYAYFSSTSTSWLLHARNYVQAMRQRLALDGSSFVVEIASNDGYLLKNFVAAGIPCLGIEPTRSTAAVAMAQGIPVLEAFFGAKLAGELAARGQAADLVLGNNVYAHVPDINDFTAGLKGILKPGGTITLEFPHLLQLIRNVQFDTVYHEHFSYLSLQTVSRIFERCGLRVWNVEELATHGGSLRVFGCHGDDPRATQEAVGRVIDDELQAGLRNLETYRRFQAQAELVKLQLLDFLVAAKREGRKVGAYGAAAKGNTLLNFSGIRSDLLPMVCDAAPSKQGKYLPGSHIPILHPEALREFRPDHVLVLPWNIIDEVSVQHAYVKDWGGKFVTAIPLLNILA
ncbi:MAG: class I SAM-dependent methyltransferase [Rhodocyclales bacterium]|nr:class I SAM-dependent methyltransferase [Rhodocyclales bacterium]